MSTQLTPADRSKVLDSVMRALMQADPECFAEHARTRSGSVEEIEGHLDPLIDIVRRTTASRIEPFQAQFLDDICSKCPHQFVSGYCLLRDVNRCVLFEHARVIVEAIAEALEELRDPEYVRLHPTAGQPATGGPCP